MQIPSRPAPLYFTLTGSLAWIRPPRHSLDPDQPCPNHMCMTTAARTHKLYDPHFPWPTDPGGNGSDSAKNEQAAETTHSDSAAAQDMHSLSIRPKAQGPSDDGGSVARSKETSRPHKGLTTHKTPGVTQVSPRERGSELRLAVYERACALFCALVASWTSVCACIRCWP